MQGQTNLVLAELREFANFTPREQRYIKRSLDIAFGNGNPVREWARDRDEEYSIRAQDSVYGELDELRKLVKRPFSLNAVPIVMPTLISITAFDLGQGGLQSFSAYRFLYERLLGALARKWLPSAFCAASSLPHLEPERRRDLLQSISEAAATAPGWSEREPFFFPKWVDKND